MLSLLKFKIEYIYINLFLFTFLLLAYEVETSIGTLRAIVITSFLYFYFFYGKKIYGKRILLLYVFLLLYLIIAYLYTGFISVKSFSQIIFLFISVIFLYNIFIQLGLKKIYKYYIMLSVFISIGILLQHLGYILKISFLYDFSYFIHKYKVSTDFGMYRAHFIFPEPATISYIMSLAFSMSFYSFVYNKKLLDFYIKKSYGFLIIVAYLITFSSLGYIVVILTIFSIVRVRIKSLFLFLFFVIITYLYLINNESFMYRIDGVLSLFDGDNLSVAKMNLSVWALYSNIVIASNNFIEYFPIGVGIANHPISFDYYHYLLNDVDNVNSVILNKENAGGLLIRISSEFGFIGIILVLYFLINFKIHKTDNFSLYLLSNAFLIGIIIILIRHGAYISSLTIFYFVGYYFIGKSKNKYNEIFESINCERRI
jgi:hypothetical protein